MVRFKIHKYQEQISTAIERAQFIPFRPECSVCLDTDIWLPNGFLEICPFVDDKTHIVPPHAANTVVREAKRVDNLYSEIDEGEFDIARILAHYSQDNRCSGDELLGAFFPKKPRAARRWLMNLIENLRSKWLLPIGSSRTPPTGYWIITGVDEYAQWLHHGLQASKTQFSKFYKNARHNYPKFAEQLKLKFAEESNEKFKKRERG